MAFVRYSHASHLIRGACRGPSYKSGFFTRSSIWVRPSPVHAVVRGPHRSATKYLPLEDDDSGEAWRFHACLSKMDSRQSSPERANRKFHRSTNGSVTQTRP